MAANYDLKINQGSDYKLTLTIKDKNDDAVDLTGHEFSGQIRRSVGDETIVASLAFNILNQTTNEGQVEITLSAATSSAIEMDSSRPGQRNNTVMVYDIESVSGGVVTRWLQGTVIFSPEVTR